MNIGISDELNIGISGELNIGISSELSIGISELSIGISELLNISIEILIPIVEIPKLKYDNIICHYINLDRREDRKIHMEKQLEYFDNVFAYKRISAKDGKTINIGKYVKAKILPPNPRFKGKPFRRGQIGCIQSHIASWRDFLKTDKKYLLNLEDDILINKKYFEKMFPKIMSHIKKLDFDWLYLGRQCLGYKAFYVGPVVRKYFYIPKTFGFGAHAYMLSRDGAKNMIKYYTSQKLEQNSYIMIILICIYLASTIQMI